MKRYKIQIIIKQFLDALNLFPEAIRTWTNAWVRNFWHLEVRAELVPVKVVKTISIVAIMALFLTACGERRTTEQQRSPDMETMGAPDRSTLRESQEIDTIPGAGVERTVDIEAKDHVYFPREITARPGERFYVNLINGGNEGHNIYIDLPDAPKTFGEPIPTGQSRTILVNAPAQPGRYQVYCPVEDHRERGMIATLIVE
jgi:plastocyanin